MKAEDRGVSPLLATIILVAIVFSAGLAVYSMTSGFFNVWTSRVDLQVTSVDICRAADKTLLSISVKNTGSTPIWVAVGSSIVSDGLSSIDAMNPPTGPDPSVGVTIYTAVYLPAGSYTLKAWSGDGGDLFVKGPGYSGWTGLGGSFSVIDQRWHTYTINSQGGIYEIALHAYDSYGPNEGAELKGSLHGERIVWAVTVWNARGDYSNYGVVKNNPVSPSSWNCKTYGGFNTETDGENFRIAIYWGDGSVSGDVSKTGDEGLILGVVEPGSVVSGTWLIDSGNYGVPSVTAGERYTVTVKAYAADGSTHAETISASAG